MAVDQQYKKYLADEVQEWKKIEKESLARGIPWWVDLRRAKIKGKNIFWREDPLKENIMRGNEKKRLIRLAGKPGEKVLDIGCGSGWLSLELARKGLDVIGFDASGDRINTAKHFSKINPYKKNFGRLKYLAGDINEISFPDNYFDTLVVWDSLHHFPNLDEILAKSSRWLKAGGELVVFDHLGNPFLKIGRKLLNIPILGSAPAGKIIPYEDTLGKKMIDIIGKYFIIKEYNTVLSFPVSALLYLILSKDIFIPFLRTVKKIDSVLCSTKIFVGEYFFLYAEKR